jgi:excisionase family DNA binding protein
MRDTSTPATASAHALERAASALEAAAEALRDAAAASPAPRPAAATVDLTTAAELLGVSRATTTRWANARRLPTIGPRNARRVPMAAIDAFVEEAARMAAEAARGGRRRPAGSPELEGSAPA